MLREGTFNKVPLMIGTNENEGEFFLALSPGDGLIQKDRTSGMIDALLYRYQPSEIPELREKILDEMFPNLEEMEYAEFKNKIIELMGESRFLPSMIRTAQLVSSHNVPTYVYRFDYKGHHSVTSIVSGRDIQGVPHYEELQYQFDMPLFGLPRFSGKDREVQDRMLKMWTDFAKTGFPTPDNKWTSFRPDSQMYFRFSTDQMDDRPCSPHQELYNQIYDGMFIH
jgi:carboxylesterase type B